MLIFALCVQGVDYYASYHPSKNQLIEVQGIVKEVKLGRHGRATRLKIKSHFGTHRYSSYYGIVWPGMELIRTGNQIKVLAERNNLNRGDFITGKSYFIWELVYGEQMIIKYEDILRLVSEKDSQIHLLANYLLVISILFFLFAYIRKITQNYKIE